MYDAEDFLEDFHCYEQKVKIEGSAMSSEAGTKFFHDFIQGNLNKLAHIKERLGNHFRLLKAMGLHQAIPRFDRSVRPKTTSFLIEAKVLGRDKEIKELIRLLGVPANSRRGPSRPKRKRSAIRSSASNQVCASLDNNKATITSVPVLPIVGIGGVEKTTLAQNICNHPQVKSHFDMIPWICVSDDFDVKRLTKEALEQFSGKAPTKDNLNSLQTDLANRLYNRRFLIVLDDMWAENGELRQEETDILPALWLSYMYLPFHLKRCFSFCAVYPKDYNFVMEDLAEIWVAEGFVEPQCNIPLQQSGCEYFEELAHLSFFQKLHGKYVIHDLMYDMAQLVSKDECFIIKKKNDLERIPQNVRHLSVFRSEDVNCSDLLNLCKQTKLRTLLCYMSLKSKTGNVVMEKWCTEFLCMSVMVCSSISKWGLPGSISDMKNLRCLKILDSCDFKHIPAAFCHLYNLQVFCARKCSFWVIPRGFSNLINLQKFESQFLKIHARLLNNFDLINRDLSVCNICEINKGQAARIELLKEDFISSLTLKWSEGTLYMPGYLEHNEIEVFEALHPPTNIKSIRLECYPGEDLPSWFHGSDDPTIFSSLTEIMVIGCPRLLSLEQFLQPAYMPAIKKILIKDCTSLEYVPVERFGGLPSLEELWVHNCPMISSQYLLAPSLKKLVLEDSGNLGGDIDCRSLTTFHLLRYHLSSLTFNTEKFSRLTHRTIQNCRVLETLNGGWPIPKRLFISVCPSLKWENGIVLPSSLQNLSLYDCGYFSVRCLENLTSLESLEMNTCKHIEYIPCDLWSSNLKSLQKLIIMNCEDLVSIGGPEGIAHIPQMYIVDCPKLKEVQQPLRRGY